MMTTRRSVLETLAASAVSPVGGVCAAITVPPGSAPPASPATPASRALPAMPRPDAVTVFTSARDTGQRLAAEPARHFTPGRQPREDEVSINVFPGSRFQTLVGIGGAITDATAEVFDRLPSDAQRQFLAAYFDPHEGIGYTLARTTVHSCDFSSASYTYVQEGDAALRTFSVAPDRAHRLPLLHRAIDAAGGHLPLFVSPWSAPAFMKDNASMLRGGHLLPAFRDAWAQYLVRFIQAYEAEGVPVWGLTVQNEPMATQRWESMIYTAEEERDFIRDHLGPALARAGLGGKRLIAWDHNRDLLPHRAHVILDDPQAARFVWGLGFHWYETWAGGEPMHANVRDVQASYPDKPVLLTEAAAEGFDPARLQDWANGERYGRSLVQDFNDGAVAWCDWNLLLDERGGPNHVGNYCFAAVHADPATGGFVRTPIYWALGHFSKFIRPGARRVSATSTRSVLRTTGWLNPDGRMAVVVMNDRDTPVGYALVHDGSIVHLEIPAHGFQTVVYAA